VPIEIEPATQTRFDDVATVLGPKDPAANVCWCLSHRLDSKANRALVGPARGEYVRALTARPVAPEVLVRNVVLLSTVLSVPVLVGVALMLG
jgi:hypothetical protein